MQVNCIDDIRQFDRLKATWNRVYASDPHATIFVSWAWLKGWFECTSEDWLVVAVRPDDDSPYVAFLPLSYPYRKLSMAGSPMADHVGFVCLPQYEKEAIAAFADYVQRKLTWEQFMIREMLDPRLELFLENFSSRKFAVKRSDNTSCPYISLPDSWEQYLHNILKPKTRKKVQYYIRRIEHLGEFHETNVQVDNLENQIETLLTLWQMRWGRQSEDTLNSFRTVFSSCFENNNLWLNILWDGVTPIAGMAAFTDHENRCFSYYISGYDDQFAKLSPGSVIVGKSIRYAIENKFRIYDFLRGAESYKFSFGATERFNTNVIIRPKSLQLAVRKRVRRLRTFLRSR